MDWYVFHPWRITLVALGFFVAFAVLWLRRSRPRRVGDWALAIPAALWALAAVWEWAVQRSTPEANIRIDLLLIVPLLLIASVAGIVLTIWRRA